MDDMLDISFIEGQWILETTGEWQLRGQTKRRNESQLVQYLLAVYPGRVTLRNVEAVILALKARAPKKLSQGQYQDKLLEYSKYLPIRLSRTIEGGAKLSYYLLRNPGKDKSLIYVAVADEPTRVAHTLQEELESRNDGICAAYMEWKSHVNTNALTVDGKSKSNVFGDTLQLIRNRLLAKHMFVEKIEPLSYDKDEYCLRYVDLSTIHHAPTPAWDSFLARVNKGSGSQYAADVFCAKFWQVFSPGNTGREALWIHGFAGKDGKSTVSQALVEIVGGEFAASVNGFAYASSFFFSSLHGKAFAVIADNPDPRVISHKNIHNILGGDMVPVEYKGKQSFNARVAPKLLINSNCMPEIDDVRHEVSRLLYLRISAPSKEILEQGDNTFKDKLVAEAPGFLAKCREAFPKYCPTNADIVLPQCLKDLRSQCIAEKSLRVEKFIESTFEFDEDATVPALVFAEVLDKFVRRIMKQDKTCSGKYLRREARARVLQHCTKQVIEGEAVIVGLGLKQPQAIPLAPSPEPEPKRKVIKMDEEFYRKAAEFV